MISAGIRYTLLLGFRVPTFWLLYSMAQYARPRVGGSGSCQSGGSNFTYFCTKNVNNMNNTDNMY